MKPSIELDLCGADLGQRITGFDFNQIDIKNLMSFFNPKIEKNRFFFFTCSLYNPDIGYIYSANGR